MSYLLGRVVSFTPVWKSIIICVTRQCHLGLFFQIQLERFLYFDACIEFLNQADICLFYSLPRGLFERDGVRQAPALWLEPDFGK